MWFTHVTGTLDYFISLFSAGSTTTESGTTLCDVCHSGYHPALCWTRRVAYTDVNSRTTKHRGKVSSNFKERVLFLVCVHPLCRWFWVNSQVKLNSPSAFTECTWLWVGIMIVDITVVYACYCTCVYCTQYWVRYQVQGLHSLETWGWLLHNPQHLRVSKPCRSHWMRKCLTYLKYNGRVAVHWC